MERTFFVFPLHFRILTNFYPLLARVLISEFNGPSPTLVTYDLKTIKTSSIFFGPTPTSEQMAEAETSFDVTKG